MSVTSYSTTQQSRMIPASIVPANPTHLPQRVPLTQTPLTPNTAASAPSTPNTAKTLRETLKARLLQPWYLMLSAAAGLGAFLLLNRGKWGQEYSAHFVHEFSARFVENYERFTPPAAKAAAAMKPISLEETRGWMKTLKALAAPIGVAIPAYFIGMRALKTALDYRWAQRTPISKKEHIWHQVLRPSSLISNFNGTVFSFLLFHYVFRMKPITSIGLELVGFAAWPAWVAWRTARNFDAQPNTK